MAIRVLVVDDSGFFRRRVSEMLNADPLLEVVDTAENGEQAIQKASQIKPDVITMDIEMPVLNGIDATRKIMSMAPVPIIMFSSLTTEGAQATLDALDAGALDFLPKRFEDIAKDKEEARRLLCQRVRAVARKRVQTTAPSATSRPAAVATPAARPIKTVSASHNAIKLVAIGTSTGGPV
ncbi:MAG: response regulator, partial [Thioalkalispiraceae bacterium]